MLKQSIITTEIEWQYGVRLTQGHSQWADLEFSKGVVVVSWPHPATYTFYCFPSFENNKYRLHTKGEVAQ